MPQVRMWSQRLLLVVAATCSAYPRSVPGLFSVEETERIVALFDGSEPSRDVRDDFQVRRTNRWLGGAALAAGAFDWVMAKILAADDSWGGARWADVSSFLAERVEFVLLHEFAAADGFGWHVDATPNDVLDDKHRFLNVNVVLSDPGDYDGGALQVGATNVSLGRGDLHVYRASTPHRVYEVTRGVRRTLVVATKFGGDRFGLRDGPRGRRPFDATSTDRTLRPRFESDEFVPNLSSQDDVDFFAQATTSARGSGSSRARSTRGSATARSSTSTSATGS
mmetsp:Transcript_31489/g.102284  ORF Transcript_31489/g.102284 Transcript_31489/m.102284 type:complete len:280 (-) Transcript_31489:423-1262(-)